MSPNVIAQLIPKLFQELESQGFALQGALDLDQVDPVEWQKHVDRYDEWIADGRQGEMQYLVRGRDRRANPKLVFPSAQSVLCVAYPYPAIPAGSMDPAIGPRYASYLRGEDYHDLIKVKMDAALTRFRDAHAAEIPAQLEWKICVDTSAVLERAWGALTGIGWIGKNSMLIHPRLGSYFFIGVAYLNVITGHRPVAVSNYCGHCSSCLDACPTGAFVEPGLLDARKCTSYLTLEKRGSLEGTPEEVLKGMGAWVAGCDVCQEVCPFNRKRILAEASLKVDDGPTSLKDWKSLLEESEEQYKRRVRGTALSRIKPVDFSRNLAGARDRSGPKAT